MYYKQRHDQSYLADRTGSYIDYSTPGIVAALSVVSFYWSKVPNVYGTMRILLIAYVTRYILLLLRGNTAYFGRHNRAGGGRIRFWIEDFREKRRIIIPIIKIKFFELLPRFTVTHSPSWPFLALSCEAGKDGGADDFSICRPAATTISPKPTLSY